MRHVVRVLDRGLSAAPLACLLLAAGCGSPASSDRQALTAPSQLNLPAAPQADGAAALATVRRATAAFHDVDQALAAGYAAPSGPCDESPAGAMGIHTPNPALLASMEIDPEKPEVLLYLPNGSGGFRLVGVEYLQPVLLRNTTNGEVAPWFAQTPWPSTHVVVNAAPSVFGRTFDGPMPGHVPGMPWHYDLHVWAWAPNPTGTFSSWNPAISCS